MSAENDLLGRFQRAAASLRRARCRPEIELTEIIAPVTRASDSLAYAATVTEELSSQELIGGQLDVAHLPGSPGSRGRGGGSARELATGRFLLLHSPRRSTEWGDEFRIVTYVKAEVERDLGHDELMASVAWSWLLESLDRAGARYRREGGTASRLLSEGFGQLADTDEYIDVELRASWTPRGEDLGAHLEAWTDMVCTFGGLPPVTEGVFPLRRIP